MSTTNTQIEVRGQELLTQARSFMVLDREHYQQAGRWIREVIRPLKEEILATFRPRIDQAYQLHKALVATEKRFLEPVEQAERMVGVAMETFDREDRRQIEEARRKAEETRRKLEEEAKLQAALEAEARGEKDLANTMLEIPQPVFVPPTPEPVKAEGVSHREIWSATVDDLVALAAAVASRALPAKVITPNMPVLNGMARSLKAELRIPGVRAVVERTTVFQR